MQSVTALLTDRLACDSSQHSGTGWRAASVTVACDKQASRSAANFFGQNAEHVVLGLGSRALLFNENKPG
jgi:hypothetical protein